jgi:hypothetical protein
MGGTLWVAALLGSEAPCKERANQEELKIKWSKQIEMS